MPWPKVSEWPAEPLALVSSFMAGVVAPSYATTAPKIDRGEALWAGVVANIVFIAALPTWGKLSDRIRRKAIAAIVWAVYAELFPTSICSVGAPPRTCSSGSASRWCAANFQRLRGCTAGDQRCICLHPAGYEKATISRTDIPAEGGSAGCPHHGQMGGLNRPPESDHGLGNMEGST
jgi:hypothetical protein